MQDCFKKSANGTLREGLKKHYFYPKNLDKRAGGPVMWISENPNPQNVD